MCIVHGWENNGSDAPQLRRAEHQIHGFINHDGVECPTGLLKPPVHQPAESTVSLQLPETCGGSAFSQMITELQRNDEMLKPTQSWKAVRSYSNICKATNSIKTTQEFFIIPGNITATGERGSAVVRAKLEFLWARHKSTNCTCFFTMRMCVSAL